MAESSSHCIWSKRKQTNSFKTTAKARLRNLSYSIFVLSMVCYWSWVPCIIWTFSFFGYFYSALRKMLENNCYRIISNLFSPYFLSNWQFFLKMIHFADRTWNEVPVCGYTPSEYVHLKRLFLRQPPDFVQQTSFKPDRNKMKLPTITNSGLVEFWKIPKLLFN